VLVDIRPGFPGGDYPLHGSILLRSMTPSSGSWRAAWAKRRSFTWTLIVGEGRRAQPGLDAGNRGIRWQAGGL
jgi:hypothetical protein